MSPGDLLLRFATLVDSKASSLLLCLAMLVTHGLLHLHHSFWDFFNVIILASLTLQLSHRILLKML